MLTRLQSIYKFQNIVKRAVESQDGSFDPKARKLSKADFKGESLPIITKTLQSDLAIPDWSEFCQEIENIYTQCRTISDGKVASFIPQLGRLDSNTWGVAICSVDGQRASWGDVQMPFSIQSVAHVFSYSLAATELGGDYVHKYVGQEPSGRLCDALVLDSHGKPHNPIINSGAILVSSMIQNEKNLADRYEYVLNQFKKVAGNEFIGFNNSVYMSEREKADRNIALSYFMKENKCFPNKISDVTEVVDFYYQLCSIEANCESLAVMAATLANGGVCPITEEHCFDSRACRDVLTLMNSCGMYDYSGQFSFHIGLPSKSSASGVVMIVIPNVLGIVLWSPPLDELGNSARGIAFCQKLIEHFNFHNYDSLVHTESHKVDPRRKQGDDEKNLIVALLFAAESGDMNTIRRIYMKGIDMGLKDYDKRTALHLAACEGHTHVVEFLLHVAKVQPEPRDRWNMTPLDNAKQYNHKDVIQLLQDVIVLSEEKKVPTSDTFYGVMDLIEEKEESESDTLQDVLALSEEKEEPNSNILQDAMIFSEEKEEQKYDTIKGIVMIY
uniref:glutaminase n=1 Tax=Acrobeloides nanus TaxID=290746 RepID=A0A914E0Z4_9BILA